jgi:hypothetical protein
MTPFWKQWFQTAAEQYELRFESPMKSQESELNHDIEEAEQAEEDLAAVHRRQLMMLPDEALRDEYNDRLVE